METIVNVIGDIVKVGGGLWLISWLKDIIKDTFFKIESLEKRVTKIEQEEEFRQKYNKNGRES